MSKQNKRTGQRDDARQETKSTAFDDVAALIKERKKYVDWIAALEAKRDLTPAHVYERVHADYETRLDAVVAKLATHQEELAERQADLSEKIAEIDEEMQLHEESRSETELRAHVGELTAAALTEALRIVDTELDRLTIRHNALQADLTRIEEFFAVAEAKGLTTSTTGKRRNQTGFDELSFLHSVVGAPKHPEERVEKKVASPPRMESPPPLRPVEVPTTPPEVPAPRPTPAPSPRPTPAPAPPAPRPTPAPTPPPPPAPEVPAPAPPPVVPPPQARPSTEKPAEVQADGVVEKAVELPSPPTPVMRPSIAMQMASLTIDPDAQPVQRRNSSGIIKTGDALTPSLLDDLKPKAEGGDKPFAANVASNNPLSLKSSGSGDVKTLKCRECGAMNDPSEWYCERCGAELSAI